MYVWTYRVPIKPVNGIFDMATKTMQGVYNSVVDHDIYRVRLPRVFVHNVITEYSPDLALRHFVLNSLADGKYSRDEAVSHYVSDTALYLITKKRVFSINEKYARFSINWKVNFEGKKEENLKKKN
jgi:hypothetical protein